MKNKISYASTIVKQLVEENINPFEIEFVTQGESFTISHRNITQYYMDYGINQKFIIL